MNTDKINNFHPNVSANDSVDSMPSIHADSLKILDYTKILVRSNSVEIKKTQFKSKIKRNKTFLNTNVLQSNNIKKCLTKKENHYCRFKVCVRHPNCCCKTKMCNVRE